MVVTDHHGVAVCRDGSLHHAPWPGADHAQPLLVAAHRTGDRHAPHLRYEQPVMLFELLPGGMAAGSRRSPICAGQDHYSARVDRNRRGFLTCLADNRAAQERAVGVIATDLTRRRDKNRRRRR